MLFIFYCNKKNVIRELILARQNMNPGVRREMKGALVNSHYRINI